MKQVPFHLRSDEKVEEELPPYTLHDDDGLLPSEIGSGEGSTSSSSPISLDPVLDLAREKSDLELDYARYTSSGPGLDSRAELDATGQINIWVKLNRPLPPLPDDAYAPQINEYAVSPQEAASCPPLNIVIFVVGSRGDVQPFISLALALIKSNGHRVRIATHPDFKDFVLSANERLRGHQFSDTPLEGRLEHFDIGGDPAQLMAYMVKNPGLLPGFASLTNGDIKAKRRMTKQMLAGFFFSCFAPGNVGGEFAADAIISNPPAFAHVHIAEALGIPLLVSFTMPWTPTTAFSHPLVNVQSSNAEPGMTNYLSYSLADVLIWQGLGDVINSFRSYKLGLPPLSMRTGPSVVDRLKVPCTYAWSESLLPKPKDWKNNIGKYIVGFYFLDKELTYQPDQGLADFLASGQPPVYIGFGSIVVDNPEKLTRTIFEAVELAGVRAVVNAGWSDLGGVELPPTVYLLKKDVPHDWLFAADRVAAVCHHGGAGTTACGLRHGRPTVIVPFFGDQRFWGESISSAGAGPTPIPYAQLTAETLSTALTSALSDSARTAAAEIAQRIASENGAQNGVDSFHRHLPIRNMRCDVVPERLALWWCESLCLRLSGPVAGVLVEEGKIRWKDLAPHRSKEHDTSRHYADPFRGGGQAILSLITETFGSTAQIFHQPHHGLVNMFYGIPKASFDVVGSVHEGFDNIPGMLGSRVRPKGKVDSFTTGWREGYRGFGFGLWDGITGLVTEPWDGYKSGGMTGAISGVGKSYINLAARPAAGSLGLFVHPFVGAFRGARTRIGQLGFSDMATGYVPRVLSAPRTSASEYGAKAYLPPGSTARASVMRDFEKMCVPEEVKRRRKARVEEIGRVEREIFAEMMAREKASKKGKEKEKENIEGKIEEGKGMEEVGKEDGKQGVEGMERRESKVWDKWGDKIEESWKSMSKDKKIKKGKEKEKSKDSTTSTTTADTSSTLSPTSSSTRSSPVVKFPFMRSSTTNSSVTSPSVASPSVEAGDAGEVGIEVDTSTMAIR